MAAVQKHRRLHRGPRPKRRVHEHHREHLLAQAADGSRPACSVARARAGDRSASADQSSIARKSRLRHDSTARSPASSRSASSSRERKRWKEAQRLRIGRGSGQNPVSPERALHLSRRAIEFEAEEKAHPVHVHDMRQCCRRRCNLRADPIDVREQSSRSITAILASAAAHGTGPPPKVDPRSPTAMSSPAMARRGPRRSGAPRPVPSPSRWHRGQRRTAPLP